MTFGAKRWVLIAIAAPSISLEAPTGNFLEYDRAIAGRRHLESAEIEILLHRSAGGNRDGLRLRDDAGPECPHFRQAAEH